VVEVVKKANPQAKILISLGGWADSAGDKYSRYNYSIFKSLTDSVKLA
jgi:GH18 family chitinase